MCVSHCFKIAAIFRVVNDWKIKSLILVTYQVSIFSKVYVCLIVLIMKVLHEVVKAVSACLAC